jgi:hypothetical protein
MWTHRTSSSLVERTPRFNIERIFFRSHCFRQGAYCYDDVLMLLIKPVFKGTSEVYIFPSHPAPPLLIYGLHMWGSANSSEQSPPWEADKIVDSFPGIYGTWRFITILYLSILLHAILNSLCIIESVSNATNCFSFFHFHLKQHVSALDGHLQVS